MSTLVWIAVIAFAFTTPTTTAKEEKSLHLRFSLPLILWFFVNSLILVSLIAAFLFSTRSEVAAGFAYWLIGLVFSFPILIRLLQKWKPAFSITQEGVTRNQGFDQFLQWRDISSISLKRSRRFISLVFKSEPKESGPQHNVHTISIEIPLNMMDESAQAIIALAKHYARDHNIDISDL
jgi:hypothetical protein